MTIFEPQRTVTPIETPDEVFKKYPVATFTALGRPTIAFPVESVRETGGNRIVRRDRPYRDGTKLDDTGSQGREWQLSVVFNNSLDEPDVADINGTSVLYPDILNELLDYLSVHATGDMVIPTRGLLRVRMSSYDRMETPGEVDTVRLSITVMEDNEDGVDADSYTAPTVQGSAVSIVNLAVDNAQAEGIWDSNFSGLGQLVSQLQTLANAPAEQAKDLEAQARAVMAAGYQILEAFSLPGTAGRAQFTEPESAATVARVHQIIELAARQRIAASLDRPVLRTVVFDQDQSLASIAAMLGIDYMSLLSANPDFYNPDYIPQGTEVKVPDEPLSRQG